MSNDSTGRQARSVRPATDRLLCDAMLGKLVVYLRMCGFDTTSVDGRERADETSILVTAREAGRRLLSRDADLVARTDDGVLVTEHDVGDQLDELWAAGFELTLADPPTRCGRCNGVLHPADPDIDRPDYAPSPDEFDCWRCVECGQYFWKGSHWDRVRARLRRTRQRRQGSSATE